MSKKRFANVWDAIEDTPAQAENMKLRSALIMALNDHIARTGLSQSEAAKRQRFALKRGWTAPLILQGNGRYFGGARTAIAVGLTASMPKMHGVASKSRCTSIGVILANASINKASFPLPCGIRSPRTIIVRLRTLCRLHCRAVRGGPPEATGLVPRAKL